MNNEHKGHTPKCYTVNVPKKSKTMTPAITSGAPVIYVLDKQRPAVEVTPSPLAARWEPVGYYLKVQDAYQAFDKAAGPRRLRAEYDCFNGVKSYVVNQV